MKANSERLQRVVEELEDLIWYTDYYNVSKSLGWSLSLTKDCAERELVRTIQKESGLGLPASPFPNHRNYWRG